MKTTKENPDEARAAAKTLIESIVGDATKKHDKVNRIVAAFTDDGDEFTTVENDATMKKAEKLTKVWLLRKGLEGDPALLKAVKNDLREKIIISGAGTSEKTLREDERQDLELLVLRGCFKLPRTTAWRYKKLMNHLEAMPDLDPGQWGTQILKDGGILQCVAVATKAKKDTPVTSDADQEAGEEETKTAVSMHIQAHRDAAKCLTTLTPGTYLLPTIWLLDDEGVAVTSVNLESELCEALFKALRNDGGITWHGLDPAEHPIKFANKPKSSQRGLNQAATKPAPTA